MNRRSHRSHELTREERSRGGHARAKKLRAQRATVERMKLEAMVSGPTPRRRRGVGDTGNVNAMRDPYAPAYPAAAAPPAPVAPARVLPANEQQACDRGLTGPVDIGRRRRFDSGRYEW
jgi:hypothetical protein